MPPWSARCSIRSPAPSPRSRPMAPTTANPFTAPWPSAGSVRARAKQYRLSWDEANPGSCGLQDGQHGHAAAEELESAAIGGNMLMVAGARAEEAAQFIVCATEPSGGSGAFEAPHWSVAPFDAAVVLLQPVIQVSTGSVPHAFAQRGADRPGVAVVAIGRDPVRYHAGHRLGGTKERLRGSHVAVFTEQHVDQVPVPVDSAIQIAPAPVHLQVS